MENTMNTTTTMETTNTTKKVSYRQDFIKVISTLIENEDILIPTLALNQEDFEKMVLYFNTQINKSNTVNKGTYKPTEKGMIILDILMAYEGIYKTGKEIAEGSNNTLKANGVSGSIRGLITNNFVSATNDSPKKYIITQLGIDYMNDIEE